MDDYEYFEEPDFIAGQSQWQQVGGGGNYLGTVMNDKRLGNIQLSLMRGSMTDEEWLYRTIMFWAYQHGIIGQINTGDIQHIIDLVPHKKYKNPQALLLGYYVVKNRQIDIEKLDKCDDFISQDQTVRRADIVRYARLVISLQ